MGSTIFLQKSLREHFHIIVTFTNLLKGKRDKSNHLVSWKTILVMTFNELNLKVKEVPSLDLPVPS